MKETYVGKSKLHGKGLFINESAKPGDVIDYIHGDIHVFRHPTNTISKKMMDWIGTGRYSWIDTSNSKFRFINHSCDPNVAHVSERRVIAIKNLKKGDELVYDYSLTEAEPGWQIQCSCGTKDCRRIIGPIYTIPQKTFDKYKKYIPKKFQKIYKTEMSKNK